MIVEHKGKRPKVHDTAYVAPNAVLSGEVTIGENTSILFGAILTADGGAIQIGANCVIMENTVLRGTPKHPLELGNNVLVGPHAHLSGCIAEDDVFLATGATVFNGAHLRSGVEVRINGIVHVNSVLAANAVVPIGWIAVGNPAEIFPPDQHDDIWNIQKSMDFPGTVWGVKRSVSRRERTQRYAHALLRHRDDRVL